MHTTYLGGAVVSTSEAVRGEPGVGTTADLQESTGELLMHLLRTKQDAALVMLELLRAELPGDPSELTCVRLSPAEAARLGALLSQAARAAQGDGASDADTRHP